MSGADPRIEAFFERATVRRGELQALRKILLDCPVTEEFKWRSPCYTFQDGNVATLWGFKDRSALGFFKGVLLKDEHRILVAPGDNSRSVRMAQFTSIAEIAGQEAILKDYINEAVELEKAGLKVEFKKDDLVFPEELTKLLEDDPELKAAFAALTPGRRRGYILHFSQPKQSATKVARIKKYTARILAGKGLNDR